MLSWQRGNRPAVRDHNNRSYKKHAEVRREQARQRYLADPLKARVKAGRRRAAKQRQQPQLSAIDRARYQELYEIARARTMQTGIRHHVHHDKPLARGGLDHPDNLLVIPAALNLAIGAHHASTWDYISS